MADEPYIDVHIHYWDHSVEGLDWSWLRSGYKFRQWEGTGELDAPRYTTPEFVAEAEGTGLIGAVHVHAADPLDDRSVETAWLENVADETGMPNGMVGGCILGDPGAPALLRRHAAHGRLRGVRDWQSAGHLGIDEIGEAMDTAAELGLSVELRRAHTEFGILEEIAARWPTVTLALSHACLPLERTPAELAAWSAAMGRLAKHDNVVCKISAVAGASEPDWTPDVIKPWILECVGNFGADRCMFGSNFPVDRQFGSYRALIDAYRHATAELTPAEREAVFHGTAERTYRLEV